MKKHTLWMILGCGIPLLFIFLAPSFGIGGSSSLFIFIVLMFAVHLLMPHGSHGSHGHGDHKHSQHKQEENKDSKEMPLVKSKEKNKEHQQH